MKRIFAISGAVALLGLSAAYYLRGGHPPESFASVNVREATDASGNEIVSASGSLSSNGDVVITCLGSGEVARLPFAVGDYVKKGDLLCQLDPSTEQHTVDQAVLALSRAKRRLEEKRQCVKQTEGDLQISVQEAEENIGSLRIKSTNTQNKADRQKKLYSQSLASQEEFESAETEAAQAAMEFHNALLAKQEIIQRGEMAQTDKRMDVEAAEELVESNEAALKSAQDRLNATTISSPIDGVVSDLKVASSAWISRIGDNDRQPIMTISDLSHLFVSVPVDEQKIGLIRVGQKAQIASPAYPGRSFTGVVRQIAPTGAKSRDVVLFLVKVEVIGDGKNILKPPMTVEARIYEDSIGGVVSAPLINKP
jgi:multidrug resistance efflux pump